MIQEISAASVGPCVSALTDEWSRLRSGQGRPKDNTLHITLHFRSVRSTRDGECVPLRKVGTELCTSGANDPRMAQPQWPPTHHIN